MQQMNVTRVAALDFAYGNVGNKYPLRDSDQSTQFAETCARRTHELTVFNTADCGDERVTLALGNGLEDRTAIDARVAPQLFGGLVLASTKACVAADANIVKDAKDLPQAAEIVEDFLQSIGYRNGGHKGCGANGNAKSSVQHQIVLASITPAIGLLVPDDGYNERFVQDMAAHKAELLQSGFYDSWDAAAYEMHLLATNPDNFSTLDEGAPDDELHGHNGSGLYVVTQDKMGYVKDGSAFSVTLPFMMTLAEKLGGSDEERRRILLGFADDTIHVGAGIVTAGFPVFAQAA